MSFPRKKTGGQGSVATVMLLVDEGNLRWAHHGARIAASAPQPYVAPRRMGCGVWLRAARWPAAERRAGRAYGRASAYADEARRRRRPTRGAQRPGGATSVARCPA